MARKLDPSDDESLVNISVPREPTPAYFYLIVRKADLFIGCYLSTSEEVGAGRMTEERRQHILTRLWQEMLDATETPPPGEFTC